MQSSTWKYFNVLFERLNAKQLQYKCKNGKTVFENMCNVIKLGLTNTRKAIADNEVKANTQVKSYIISYLLPKAINKSLEFVTPELTVIYLELINRA